MNKYTFGNYLLVISIICIVISIFSFFNIDFIIYGSYSLIISFIGFVIGIELTKYGTNKRNKKWKMKL